MEKVRSSYWGEEERKDETLVYVCAKEGEKEKVGHERETRKRDEEMAVEGVDEEEEEEEEVTVVERGADLTLLVHLDRRL